MFLTFSVAAHTEDLNSAKDDEEHSVPNSMTDVLVPIVDRYGRGRQLKRKNAKPCERITPADREAPNLFVSGLRPVPVASIHGSP